MRDYVDGLLIYTVGTGLTVALVGWLDLAGRLVG
jgi:hypothetical protein